MTAHRPQTDGTEVADFNASWARWRQMVSEMPDIRAEKVDAVRRALQSHTYDTDLILDETIRRIAAEIDPAADAESGDQLDDSQ
jgi:hypothetical protein